MSTTIDGLTGNTLSVSGSLSSQFPNKKNLIFGIGFDAGGVRQLELDAFKCLNSNINAIGSFPSPIDGTTAKSDVTLYFARTRLIKLIESWNNILNSGLFAETRMSNTLANSNPYHKVIGANVRGPATEYLFKDLNVSGTYHYTPDFKPESIFYRMVRFLVALANNHNWYLLNNVTKQSYFALTNIGLAAVELNYGINTNFNPTSARFLAIIEEFLNILKEIVSEPKLVSKLGFGLDDLTFSTVAGRTNIIALAGYQSNYVALAKLGTGPSSVDGSSELSFLNDETKTLVSNWLETGSNNIKSLYPQFATMITRNTESEAWSFRNVLVDTSDYNQLDDDPFLDPLFKKYQTKYIACSQLDMKKPLVFSSQIINWANENDKPYIMLYNGGTVIYIPDEIKDQTIIDTLGEQPSNQINLSAYFWKIGTSNPLDPNYNKNDDVKLNLRENLLNDLDKIDFLDNLTLYLKLN